MSRSAGRPSAAVVDPEIRVVTIDELGILRAVDEDPATGRVDRDHHPDLHRLPGDGRDPGRHPPGAGRRRPPRRRGRAPSAARPGRTDWITEPGRAKLAAAGIAPPARGRAGSVGRPLTLAVRCPRCGSPDTEQISRFGSTACKALWRCRACAEPFDHVKAL